MHISLDQAIGRQPRLNRVGQSILNIGGDASAAYSLRSLTGGEPKAVRIRRDGDNEERDFTTAEIVNEAADWTNGKQETTLPADLPSTSSSITGFTISGTTDNASGTYTTDGTLLNGKLFFKKTGANDEQVRYDGSKWLLWDDDEGEAYYEADRDTEFPWDVQVWQVGSGNGGTPVFSNFVGGNPDNSAAAAYSLRKVKSDYTGPAVRIRRTSDDVEVNVSFDTNDEVSINSPVSDVVEEGGEEGDTTATTLGEFLTVNIDRNDLLNRPATGSLSAAGKVTNKTANSFDLSVNNEGSSGFQNLVSAGTPSGKYVITFNANLTSGSFTNIALLTRNPTIVNQVTEGFNSITANLNQEGSNSANVFFRVLDTAEANISFTDITITQVASDAAVHTWYDQSGNSKNATQTTDDNQPLIAEGGVLHTDDGKPALKFNGTSHRLELSAKATIENTSIFSAFRSNNNTQDSVLFHLAVNAGDVVSIGFGGATGTLDSSLGSRLRVGGSNLVGVGDNTFTSTSQSLLSYIASSSAAKIFVDSTEETDSVQARTSGPNSRIGARGDDDRFFDGDISEVILFDSDQTNNRFKIESNINNHYTIYTAAQNGFVNTWYDQSGGTIEDLEQPEDSKQPSLVTSGTLNTRNGRPIIKFIQANSTFLENSDLSMFPSGSDFALTVFHAMHIDTGGDRIGVFGSNNGGNAPASINGYRFGSGTSRRINAKFRDASDTITELNVGFYTNDTDSILTYKVALNDGTASIAGFNNGSLLQETSASVTDQSYSIPTDKAILGARSTADNFSDSEFFEVIAFATDKSSERGAIEQSLSNYYGISLS